MKALNWLVWLMVAAGFAGLLSSLRDPVFITFNDWDVQLPFGMLAFLLFITILFFVLVDRMIQNLAWLERWHKAHKMRRARALMLRGFGMLATQNIEGAKTVAADIERLWTGDQNDPFKLVFKGRLAEAEGNWDAAQKSYEILRNKKDTKLYGLRAQLRLAGMRHDTDMIRKLGAQAVKLAPDDLPLYDVYIEALAAQKEWNKAHRILHKIGKQNLMALDIVQNKRADLYLDEAEDQVSARKYGHAKNLAQKSARMRSSLQAAIIEIEALLAEGNRKAALKKLESVWSSDASRRLLPIWERLAPETAQFAYYETMLKSNPASALTHASLVKAAIADNRAMEARAHLDVLKNNHEDTLEYAETKALVARRLDHDMEEAAQWKNRADALRQARLPVAPQTKLVSRFPLPDALE